MPDLFPEWMNAVGIDQLGLDSCAGASLPSFYGGKREIGNLTLDSTDVYLAFAQRLWEHGQQNGPGSPPPHLATA